MTIETVPAGLSAYARLLMAGCAVGAFAVATPAHAAGTPAFTKIENTATAEYTGPGGPETETSDPVEFYVDKVVDVNVDWTEPNVQVESPSTNQGLVFVITNTGNAGEAFNLTVDDAVAGDDFDPDFVDIYHDQNKNGVVDPGEPLITATPVIPADENIWVIVRSNIPSDLDDGEEGDLELLAEAVSGTGAPGTVVTTATDTIGGDPVTISVVAGLSGGDDDDTGTYVIYTPATPTADVELEKSQSFLDPWGGDEKVPGTVITYQLQATVTGYPGATVTGLVIRDTVPADTSYVPGSLTIRYGSSPVETLTDAAGDDEGEAAAGDVEFDVGTATVGDVITATFQVTID